MTQIITNPTSYSEHRPEDGVKDNWAAEYAKREVDKHREAEVLDHPDGSVTPEKLSDGLRSRISEATATAQTASETANTAKNTAEVAKASADIAVKESENAYEKSLDAYEKSQVAENIATGAKNKAESAEQRSVSAEAKADAATVSAGVAIEKADAAMKEAGDALAYGINILDARINEVEIRADEALTIASHNAENKADKSELPKKVSELENDAEYITGGQVSQMDYSLYNFIMGDVNTLLGDKANKPTIQSMYYGNFPFDFSTMYNTELRTTSVVGDTLDSLSFTFGNGEYPQDYVSGISFDSGATPTAIDYTDSGILNWVGTDCSAFSYQINPEGDIATISLFIPSPNTHYDIVFYFNGNQFIGLVNGFVPATGNAVNE